jgi:hypothetical protein
VERGRDADRDNFDERFPALDGSGFRDISNKFEDDNSEERTKNSDPGNFDERAKNLVW